MHYKEGDKAALDGVSLSIARNEKVGICGRTGSGKSSILSLLFLAYRPQEGSIQVGGSDIREYGGAIRGFVSIIPQEIVIFEGSVKENLDMRNRFTTDQVREQVDRIVARSGATAEEVPAVLKDLGAKLSSGGANISTGERQLVQVVRGLIGEESEIVCMDEATSNLDFKTDHLIQKIIRSMRGKTFVVIAHKLKNIQDFDRVIVLQEGRVVENGDPKELARDEQSYFAQLVQEFDKH